MAVKHVKVAVTPDDGTSEVGTDEWNDDHNIETNTIGDAEITTHNSTKITGLAAQVENLNMGSNKVVSVTDPTAAQDAATKSYVDNLIEGIRWKQPVIAATTIAGTLATDFENTDVIDGITLATNDRILIKNQATGSENGIYTVNASGAPTRALDFNEDDEVSQSAVFAQEGTTNADTAWVLTNDGAIIVGTTTLVFAQFSGNQVGATNIGTAGVGVFKQKTGSNLELKKINNGEGIIIVDDTGNDEIDVDLDFPGLDTITDVNSDSADVIAVHQDSDTTHKDMTVDNFFKGVYDVPIPASGMYAPITEPATGLTDTEFGGAGEEITKKTWDFTSTTLDERIQVEFPMWRQYDLSTIDILIVYSFASGSGVVRWGARAVAGGDGEAIATNFGTGVETNDTVGTVEQYQYVTLSSITIGGTPASADTIHLEIYREGSDAGDTFSGTARLHSIVVRPTMNKKASA